MEYFLPYQKTRMSQSSAITVLQGELVSPEGTQEGEYLGSSSHWTAATPRCEPQGSSGCENHRILAWDGQNANERDDFSESRLLHLPTHREALNSFTRVTWFSLINNDHCHLWGRTESDMTEATWQQQHQFRLPALCGKTSI